MTSPKQLAERALDLDQYATSGPWAVNIAPNGKPAGVHQPEFSCWIPACYDDQHFIAESRTLLPALATEVLKLLEENKVMRGALIGLSPCGGGCEGPMGCMCKSSMAREALTKADGIRNEEDRGDE